MNKILIPDSFPIFHAHLVNIQGRQDLVEANVISEAEERGLTVTQVNDNKKNSCTSTKYQYYIR